MFNLLLTLFFSQLYAASTIVESSVIGCKQVSQTQYVTIQSQVDIQKTYLDKFANDPKKQEKIKKEAVGAQLKFLVGVFKEFHTDEVVKATFSHYQSVTKISQGENAQVDYPIYDSFWPLERGQAWGDYITHVMKEGSGKKEVVRVSYEVLLHVFSCVKGNLSAEKFISILNEIPFPRDPYIAFWVNTKEERHKELNRPLCFSRDFGVFGIPDEGWFFWSPIQYGANGQCPIKNQELLIKNVFVQASMPTSTANVHDNLPKAYSGSIFFGAINEDKKYFAKKSIPDFTKVVLETFNYCKGVKRPYCLGKWNELFKADEKEKFIEPGAGNFFHFLKYLSVVVDVSELSLKAEGERYLILTAKVKSPKTKKMASFDIYYGPTSLYDPLLAPKEYWQALEKALYKDDFVFYIGHAGLGSNLLLETVKKYSGTTAKKMLREKPLYLGIFNCEALSYFGFDYEGLFKPKTVNNYIYLVSSSGVEVSSLFSISYLDFLLSNEVFTQKNFDYALHDYVQSYDFLGFQKINYSRE